MPRPWLRLILLIGATILVALNGATADDGDGDADYSRSGAYLRGGIGVAWISSSSSFPMAPPQSWVTNADVQLALGWRQSERLALEVEFEWVPSHDGIGNGSWLLGANGKFFLLEGQLQPYIVMGANGYWAKPPGAPGNEVDWGFRNGLGAEFYVDENWALGVETSFVWGVGKVWRNYFLTTSVTTTYRF
jgi:opacity protein-like surface antigen